MSETILAWHYTTKEQKTRYDDGRDDSGVGTTLTEDVEPEPCEAGLHGSEDLLDALKYAPSFMLRRVRLSGDMAHQDDKAAATERTILAEPESLGEAEYAHRTFTRLVAAEALQYWDEPPEVVVDWIVTGDPSLREEARAAAWDAARNAAWTVEWAAARGAARDATRKAARKAARAATRKAARSAAWAAARSAARDELNDMAEDVIPAILGWDSEVDS